jgi:hypothetical protein
VLLLVTSCEPNRRPLGIDPKNKPQGEARDKLLEMFGSLTTLPDPGPGRTLHLIERGLLYPKQLSLVATSADSQLRAQRIELYQWSKDQYVLRDALPLNASSVSLRNVDRDDRQDVILRTSDSLGRRGMTILATDPASSKFRYLFRIDTIEPVLYPLQDTTIGLLQYDSLTDWSVGTFHFPSRLYRLQDGVYARKAFDSTWLRMIRYMRDSVTQVFQVEREKLRQQAGEISLETAKNYLRALGGLAVLHRSWIDARTFLQAERSYMSGHVSESALAFIDRLLSAPRSAAFVEVATTPAEEQQVILLAEYDEAFLNGDQYKASLVLPRLARVLTDQPTIERVTDIAALPGNTFALVIAAREFWQIIAQRYPNAGIAYRRWGILERRLGNEDSAQVLLRRSLKLDSTSREAQEIRQSLPYLD